MDKREKMKEEAVDRLKNLTSSLDLNPNLVKYFKQGKVYYSYLTAGGMVGSIDTIDYIPKYAEIIKKFEKTYEGIVYHAVEDSFGMLTGTVRKSIKRMENMILSSKNLEQLLLNH